MLRNTGRLVRNIKIRNTKRQARLILLAVGIVLFFLTTSPCLFAQSKLRFTPPVFSDRSIPLDITEPDAVANPFSSPTDATPIPAPAPPTAERNTQLRLQQPLTETSTSGTAVRFHPDLERPTRLAPLRPESPRHDPSQQGSSQHPLPQQALFQQTAPRLPLPLPPPIDHEQLQDVIQIGLQLEAESRWGDVLSHYETALRIYRNNDNLQERFRVARFHYDIGRRFNDSSYQNKINTLGFIDSLQLYDEIISRIQANYVETLDWDCLFRHGLKDIEIALQDPFFAKKVQLSASREKVARYLDEMRKKAAGWEIRNREDLKNGILHLAELAMNQLQLNPVAMLLEFTCGIVNSLDPYTTYLTPNQYGDTISMISGNFVGLGVELKSDRESLLIVRVIQDSPAQQAGLRDGDRIHSVDGVPTKGKDTDSAADLLQGREGSTVKLLIQHADERQSREISIVRRKIDVPSVEDVRILADGLGYAKLTGFQSKTCQELRQALEQLDRQGMQCFVLDMRHNPGGLLQIGVEVANMFIEEGVIVRTRGRHNSMDTPYMATRENTWKVPLIVLIDEESASASEIVAGAIRDHNRGRIIGNRSYGKGTIQAILPVCDGQVNRPSFGLRLTVEKFYSPLGWPYSGTGVEPHIKVASAKRVNLARQIQGRIQIPIVSRTVSSSPDDPCIRKAIEVSREMIPSRNAKAI